MLFYEVPEIKFIGEFEDGLIKNNLGMTINSFDTYFFGRIINGNTLTLPSLCYLQIKKYEFSQIYIGEIKDYFLHGKGKHITMNSSKMEKYFEGDFKYDKLTGLGKFCITDGDKERTVYIGEFQDEMYSGKGKIIYETNTRNGDWYEGDFYQDKKEGIGKYVFGNGEHIDDYYIGEFKNDVFEGKGKYVFVNGKYKNDYFEGEFKGNTTRKGKYIFRDHTVESPHYYEGDFIVWKKNGIGKLVEKNGNFYVGEFKDNMKEGKGKLTTIENNQLIKSEEGYWNNDKQIGPFQRYEPNRDPYTIFYA